MREAGSFRRAATACAARPLRSATLVALVAGALGLAPASAAQAAASDGIHNIQHVVMIMQENRSFDSYFGTFPGADGIPAGVCVPDPSTGSCVAPFHDAQDKNFGGPHGRAAAIKDIDEGRMDGFVNAAVKGSGCTGDGETCSPCSREGTVACREVMGYHDAREIPNYWNYAQHFVLQDNMFEAALSASGIEHNFLVSGWSARCPTEDTNPMDCVSSYEGILGTRPRAWTDITYLLAKAHVSWRYYVYAGAEPDCESDEAVTCAPVKQGPKTPGIWNPLPAFTDVQQDAQVQNIQSLTNFYTAVHEAGSCGLPNVSWIDPKQSVSEHPSALVSTGQAYVTTLIDAIMRSPCWANTAIFLSWDDWGGLYDHVMPPGVDTAGYGLRVPGLVISPYAKTGFIDHQQLSHDAYLKFIEDDFLNSGRLDPSTDGRPDSRPDVREQAPGLGDLANDFDFSQQPRPPLLLPAHPEPGPPSEPPAGPIEPPGVQTGLASSLGQTTATLNATVNPHGAAIGDCRFEYGTTVSYGSSAPCAQTPASGDTGPVPVSAALENLTAKTVYHFRIVASSEGGTSRGADRSLTTLPDPPTAVTDEASSLAQTTATLNGEVDPRGAPVGECRFEYGTSTFYEASQPCSQSPGAGTGPVDVSAPVEGLLANTGYHFRVVASNQGGSRFGADHTFTTLPNPPAVTLVRPGAGREAGGTTITITGTNLGTATAVRFGSAAAASFTAASDSEITAVSPPGTGQVDVTVLTRGGTSPTGAADRFTYVKPPAVSNVTPAGGPAAGGTSVTIAGANLAGAAAVAFGTAQAAEFVVNSTTSITAVSPPGTSGTVDVAVTTAGGTSAASANDQFKFGAPTVTAVSPASGPKAGGTSATVSGSGFAPGSSGTTVRFGGLEASSVNCASSSSCVALTPAHKAATVDVKATVGAVTSKRVPEDAFTYG